MSPSRLIVSIELKSLVINNELQMRAGGINEDHLADVVEAYENGKPLPRIKVRKINDKLYVTGGFHRVSGAIKVGKRTIDAEVREGTWHDAVLDATAENQEHLGLKRSNADKRKAVLTTIELMPTWSDRQVADHVGVSHPFVAKTRESLSTKTVENVQKRTVPESGPRSEKSNTQGGNVTTHHSSDDSKNQNSEDYPDFLSDDEPEKVSDDSPVSSPVEEEPVANTEESIYPVELIQEAVNAFVAKKIIATPQQIKDFSMLTDETQAALLKSVLDNKQTFEQALARGEEPEETVEEEIERRNKAIESWARQLMSMIDTMPRDEWIDYRGHRDAIARKIENAAQMVRQAKCHAPCPLCDGQRCDQCLNTGRMPKMNIDQVSQ